MFQEYMKKTDCCRYLSAHKNCLGGVVGFRPTCFKNSNGFPNVIFEWGVWKTEYCIIESNIRGIL